MATTALALLLHTTLPLAFCAFLGLQIYLFWTHRQMLAEQSTIVDNVWRRRCVPVPGPGEEQGHWVAWLCNHFHDGSLNDGLYTREDILQELDNWLEGHTSYLLLQRMGVMAPLLGLLITVAGFVSLQPPTAPGMDLGRILGTLTPLVFGVGTGALLALINQWLLQFAGHRINAVRTVACRWFDECVWKEVQAKPHAAANDAAEAVREMAKTINDSIAPYREAATAVVQTSELLRTASAPLVQTVERLRDDHAAILDEAKDLRGAVNGVTRSMTEIVPNIERTTAELAESVGAFKSVVQEQFGRAAEQHLRSSESLAGSVEDFRGLAAQMTNQFASLGQLVAEQAAMSQELSRSVQDDVLPAQRASRQAVTQLAEAAGELCSTERSFREASESMQASAGALGNLVREVIEPTATRLSELDQVLSSMQQAAETIRQITRVRREFASLTRSLSEAAAAAEAIRRLPQEIQAVLQIVARNQNSRASARRPWFFGLFGRSSRETTSSQNGRP